MIKLKEFGEWEMLSLLSFKLTLGRKASFGEATLN